VTHRSGRTAVVVVVALAVGAERGDEEELARDERDFLASR
jgi:hypothetical protein